jgi:hypothetical protein
MEDQVIICNMDPQLQGLGTDHMPILTTIELAAWQSELPTMYNYRMMDWEEFNKELEARLADIPAPVLLTSKVQFHMAIEALTGMIQDTTHTMVLVSKPSPHAKQWWNKELLNIKKKKNRLSSSSYKNRAISKHLAHKEHRKICNEYREAIIHAKQNHWNKLLEDISNSDVWIVN